MGSITFKVTFNSHNHWVSFHSLFLSSMLSKSSYNVYHLFSIENDLGLVRHVMLTKFGRDRRGTDSIKGKLISNCTVVQEFVVTCFGTPEMNKIPNKSLKQLHFYN